MMAQKYDNNGEELDDEEPAPSNNNGRSQNKVPAGNTNNDGVNLLQNGNQVRQPADPPAQSPVGQGQVNAPVRPSPAPSSGDLPVQAPPAQGLSDSNSRSQSTQLAADENCKTDIQKYCTKGSAKLLSNLKVLQCVDDLDNVSFFRNE
jgi:hypothetical protein